MEKPVSRTIVVAKYREDTTWAEKYSEVVIIEKGVDMANYGREASSYLYYIIRNYNNLSDYTIFCQGNPFDHCQEFLEEINDYEHSYRELGTWFTECEGDGRPQHQGLKVSEASQEYLGVTLDSYGFVAGAQFIVSKENILKHPQSFYEELLKYCSDDEKAPWVLERLWRLIFNGSSFKE